MHDQESGQEALRSVASPDETIGLELMKQIITLAAGVLALSATFIERLRGVPVYLLILLAVSWLVLIMSVFFGLQSIAAIRQSRLHADDEDNPWSDRVKRRSCISMYGFLVGIGLFAAFTFVSLIHSGQREEPAGGSQIIITDDAKK